MEQVRRDLPLAYPNLHQYFLKTVITHRQRTSRSASTVTMDIHGFSKLLHLAHGFEPPPLPEVSDLVSIEWKTWLALLEKAKPWTPKEGDAKEWVAYKKERAF